VVQTQLNAGSAGRVQGVLAELRNVTAGGQLKVYSAHFKAALCLHMSADMEGAVHAQTLR
jgi:hypothetical protein